MDNEAETEIIRHREKSDPTDSDEVSPILRSEIICQRTKINHYLISSVSNDKFIHWILLPLLPLLPLLLPLLPQDIRNKCLRFNSL